MKYKILHITIVTVLILLFSSHLSNAALRIASVSGDWSNTATWGGASVPTAADDVRINGNITVTVDIANAQCASQNTDKAVGISIIEGYYKVQVGCVESKKEAVGILFKLNHLVLNDHLFINLNK